MLTQDRLIAVRDPHGFRPLALGKLLDAWVVCSETCALDLIGATYVRDVEPGEVLVISPDGVKSYRPFAVSKLAHCVFEHVYFARPDSYVFGQSVNEVRTNFGRVLAREAPVDADVVVPIPDSGVCAAVGFAEESGIPMRMGLIRNHYVGRTFIEPQQAIRHFGVRVKLNPVRSILEGKRVVLDRRLDRARHDQPQDRQDDQGGGREGSPHAHQLSAHHLAVLLRRRHAAALRADCGHAHHRRDPEVSQRRDAQLPQSRRPDARRRRRQQVLLHLVLHRRLPGGVPARHERPTCSSRSSASTKKTRRS